MRSPLVVVVTLAGSVLTACPPPPPPEPTPCAFGAAGAGGDDCVFVWEDVCAASDEEGCVEGSAVRCDVDDDAVAPAYDCHGCGCGGTDACVDVGEVALCLSADVREAERDDEVVSDGIIDDADYVALMRDALRDPDAMTRSEALARLRDRRAEDPRRAVLVVGDNGNATVDLGEFVDGSFGDVVEDASCADADADVLEAADDGVVVLTDPSSASEATCLVPAVFPRCAPPSLSGCATAAGALAESIIVLDTDAFIAADNALLRKATRANREQWIARINENLATYGEAFTQPPASRFFEEEFDREVRFVVDAHDESVVYAVFWRAGIEAFQMRLFRDMLSDAVTDAFLLEFDITPNDCSFDVSIPDGEVIPSVAIDCQKNGARIAGQVNLGDPVSVLEQTRP